MKPIPGCEPGISGNQGQIDYALVRPQPWRVSRTLETRPGWRTDGSIPNPGLFIRPPNVASALLRHPGPDPCLFRAECSLPGSGNRSCTRCNVLLKRGALGPFLTPSLPLSSLQMVSDTQFSPKDQQCIFPLPFSARDACPGLQGALQSAPEQQQTLNFLLLSSFTWEAVPPPGSLSEPPSSG